MQTKRVQTACLMMLRNVTEIVMGDRIECEAEGKGIRIRSLQKY
jgi:hypothetical protein